MPPTTGQPQKPQKRLSFARSSLDGLSVGDAFGERFFSEASPAGQLIASRSLPAAPWTFTDDTVMAISVVDVLADRGEIDPDWLAEFFAARYALDPRRGYGATAHDVLAGIGSGKPWREAAKNAFQGEGSMGNGAAMRAAPVGAYFSEDYDRALKNARRSAAVTHAHPEGQAGAVAVAVAAAWAARGGGDPADLFEAVLEYTPRGATRSGIAIAARLPLRSDVKSAVAALGNGSRVIAEDTVPFTIWCVAGSSGGYEEAMWKTVSGLGDRDTTCAIVGGILASHPDVSPPAPWLQAREPLENMARALLEERFHPAAKA